MGIDALLFSAGATFLAYGLIKVFLHLLAEANSPLSELPGPKSPSLLTGNFLEILLGVSARSRIYYPGDVAEHLMRLGSVGPPRQVGECLWHNTLLSRLSQREDTFFPRGSLCK